MSKSESAELSASRKRFREMENELEITRRANGLLEAQTDPKRRWEVVAQIVSDDLLIEPTCRIIGVSVSGFYMWKHRKPSARSMRHEMVAEVIRQIHA